MKQIFALFCAIALVPSFSAHAWIGGPFSNNTYAGAGGDDGIYEAVAFPTGGSNGVGIFRWAVTNNLAGFDGATTTTTTTTFFDDAGNIAFQRVTVLPLSSNTFFGGVGQVSHTWFLDGVSYTGQCSGTVNSGIGSVSCVGEGQDFFLATAIETGFEASLNSRGFMPNKRFSGSGTGTTTVISTAASNSFTFNVLGSKVSNSVYYNGSEANPAGG